MKISEVKNLIKKIVQNNQNLPLMFWGPPGIGKSAGIRQVAQEKGIGFTDLRLTLLNPVDLRGLPFVDREKQKAKWLSPEFLPNGGSDKQGILFLDEINLAPLSVQHAAYQLVLDRRLGEYKLPEGWFIVAAGNREQDKANVQKFPLPLANRFLHYEIEINFDEWRNWAIKNKINDKIVSFLTKMPQHLFAMPKTGEKRFPTPRTWEYASRLMSLNETVEGSVGDGVAAEFENFLEVYSKLPDIDQILQGTEKKVPKENDVLFALSTSIIYKAKKQFLTNIFEYCKKMPIEFEMLTIRGMLNTSMENDIIVSKEWKQWADKHPEV